MDFILIEANQTILMKFDCLWLSEAGFALVPWIGFDFFVVCLGFF